MNRKQKQRMVFIVLGWTAVVLMVLFVSAQDIRSLNHWFLTSLPSGLVILGYGLFCMLVLPVFAIGLIQSTWLVFYEPYYKWRYHNGDPKLRLEEDDWRLAGNPEFPHNHHVPIDTSALGDSNDAFQPPFKKTPLD